MLGELAPTRPSLLRDWSPHLIQQEIDCSSQNLDNANWASASMLLLQGTLRGVHFLEDAANAFCKCDITAGACPRAFGLVEALSSQILFTPSTGLVSGAAASY